MVYLTPALGTICWPNDNPATSNSQCSHRSVLKLQMAHDFLSLKVCYFGACDVSNDARNGDDELMTSGCFHVQVMVM